MPREESSGEQSEEKKMPEPSASLHVGYQSDFEELLHAVATPDNAVKKQEAWASKLEVEIELKSPSGIEFVLIPAGTFMMGSKECEKATPHQVILTKPFYMGQYQVTQAQWKMVMGSNPSKFKGDNRPMESVSWKDCQKFINIINAHEGVDHYRLPTEAEWEYACRAGSQTRFSFGVRRQELPQYAWFNENSDKRTHRVGEKKPNGWGLYDMHGNVWEWCQDWYDNYRKSPVTDSAGPSNGFLRVIRGGTWYRGAGICRSAVRFAVRPGFRDFVVGFRLLRSL